MPELEDLHDPQRFARVAELHRNAFDWKPQGYIPLGLWVVDPAHARGLDYARWLEPEAFFDFQKKVLIDSLTVGSDLLPAVGINHAGTSLLNTMFGAKLLLPDAAIATLQDNGPTARPFLSDIRRAAGLRPPPMTAGLMAEMLHFARHYRQHLPAWVHVGEPLPNGPVATAMELRGSDLILDLLEHPVEGLTFIKTCAKARVDAAVHMRRRLGTPSESWISNFGINGCGLRLGDDTIGCLSPDLIRRFFLPAVRLVNFMTGGRGYVHFCSIPKSRFEHIYPVLAEAPEVKVVSSQLAFEYYAEHLDELRGRLAVESFYAPGYGYVCEKYGSFAAWADDFVPRFKNESGLVLYTQVSSLEEGREVWARWQEAHQRK